MLGDVSGQDVLEYGCGAAQFGIKLARTGAHVTGLDQSRGQLRHAAKKVAAAGVPVRLVCASCDRSARCPKRRSTSCSAITAR